MRKLIEWAIKPIGSIRKLRRERPRHVGAHFIAATADRRSERRNDVARTRREFHAHSSERLHHDARKSAPPTRMDRGDGAMPRVGEQNRHAVRRLHAEQQTGSARGQRVGPRCIRVPGTPVLETHQNWPQPHQTQPKSGAAKSGAANVNHIRMELPQRNQRHFACPDRRYEYRSIGCNTHAIIPVRKSQIQDTLAGRQAFAARAAC